MGGAKRPPFGWGGVGTRRNKDSYKCCRIETRNDLATVGGLPERQWNLEPLGMNFVTQGCVRSETSEKLEFDDPLNENAMFLRSQGLQNEAKMVPKRAEKRKKSREEGKREQRSTKRALESVLGALWSDILRFRGSPGEGWWSARLGLTNLADPAFRRGWALKVSKSAVR